MKTNLLSTVLRGRNIALVTLALSAMVTSAYANTSFATGSSVSNELTTGASGSSNAYSGATLTNWSNTNGYSFVFVPNDLTANSSYSGGVTMWNNPFTGSGGGNVVALDSDYPFTNSSNGSIYQTLTGLVAGDTVTITFGLALDEQNQSSVGKSNTPFSGVQLAVSLGGQTVDLNNLSYNGTTNWATETATFVLGANASSSEVLSFLADDGPSGGPAFVLLSNVGSSQTPPPPVPEPGSLALLSTGLIGLGGLVRSRFKK